MIYVENPGNLLSPWYSNTNFSLGFKKQLLAHWFALWDYQRWSLRWEIRREVLWSKHINNSIFIEDMSSQRQWRQYSVIFHIDRNQL
jgi:hypothetical protein